ncbi:hypothetical protein D3269_14560 [Listeria monocytogenes]|nr:hypothetical protein [Listeria monocytogenes]
MQNALGKALKNNETTFHFDEYQKTYRGQMWVLMKNGIVDIEATNAYNAAVLNGELPHESNEAQEEAELLQAVIQSVKEGIDPVTGQEISKAQGFGIISGLVFRYTVGGYKGKKFKLPKAWLNRRKKASGVKKIEKTPELEKHIRNTDPNVPRKRGIGGAHNSEEFFKNDVEIVKQTPTDIPGVSVVEYRIPELDVKGNPTGRYKKTIYKKTIYGPKVISDEEYINRGLEAANKATSNLDDGSLPREWTGKDNTGKTWRGYYEDGKITSFYPD